MASSSVSQESLDHEDFEISTRRTRVRVMRSRAVAPSERGKVDTSEAADDKDVVDGELHKSVTIPHRAGGVAGPTASVMLQGHVSFCAANSSLTAGDHESPNRLKIKDKRGWPGYLHKTKAAAKDKRKLREKRRSSGLVHVQSTEVKTISVLLDGFLTLILTKKRYFTEIYFNI